MKIKVKNTRRYRAQFTMSQKLWAFYEANKKLATQLRAEIDMSEDFERWFQRINEQIREELEKLSSERDSQPKSGVDHAN